MQNWWASSSLVAPYDLLLFALAGVLLIVLPGYALATLARPRATGLERFVFAIPCACSLIACYGLCSTVFHVPFTVLGYSVIALVLSGAAITYSVRRGYRVVPSAARRWEKTVIAIALLEGAITLAIHVGDVMPSAVDVLSHTVWTTRIAQTHVFPIALLSTWANDTNGGFYPPVFHALAAFLGGITGIPVTHAVFYCAVGAAVFLPPGLFVYTRTLTGQEQLAGLAVLASLAFEPLPFFALAQGLYPFVLSCLFIPCLLLALVDSVIGKEKRSLALAAFLGIGLFYTHPTEFVTVALLGLVTIAPTLRSAKAWGRAAGYALVLLVMWIVAALPALAAIRRTMVSGAQVEIQQRHDFASVPHATIAHLLSGYVYGIYGRNLSYPLLLAVLLGLAWCIVRRHHRGLVLAQACLIAFFVDQQSLNVLHPFYVYSFPWALLERLAPTHYWIVPLLAAIGLATAGRALQRVSRLRSYLAKPVIALGVSFGLAFPLTVGTLHTVAYSEARRIVAPSDLPAVRWLARHGEPGAVVIDDEDTRHPDLYDVPIDAGRWMAQLGPLPPLFGPGGTGPGTWSDRLYLLAHIADRSPSPRLSRLISRYHVRYVFYSGTVPPLARRHLDLAHLLASPRLRLVHAGTGTCQSARRRNCKPVGAYVFVLTGSLRDKV